MKDILEFIVSCSDEECRQIIAAIKERHRRINTVKSFAFSVGDKVKFKGRYGMVEHGEVIKVNRTTITVRTANNIWRVGSGALTRE